MSSGPQAELRTAKSEWRTARRLYAIYSSVMAHFDVGVAPCRELESPIDRADFAIRARVRNWLNAMDNRCPVAYLRQVLQRDDAGTEANLNALIRRHLDRPYKTEFDREKLDFLLVQYFAQSVTDDLSPRELTLAEVGKALHPVLGSWAPAMPQWLKDLDSIGDDVAKCHCMQDLEDFKILARGREIKANAGARFFEPPALIAFTRYNIIVRRAFFYTMRADLDVVRMNVVQLQKLGVKAIDATRAGLSERESLASVQTVCLHWRSIFQADYSAGHVFRSIKELRAASDRALEQAHRKRQEEATRRDAVEKWRRAAKAAGKTVLGRQKDVMPSISDSELEQALEVFQHEDAPESTLELAYPELTVDADPVAGTPARYKVAEVLEHIQTQVAGAAAKKAQALSVRLENSAIRLAFWEHNAFLIEGSATLGVIKSSVAARLILQEAFDDFQDGSGEQMPAALTIAHGEAGRMQEKIAEAKDIRAVEQIVYLTATAQRLIELIREAEYAWNEESR
jgi:hypothetical protein